MRSLSSFMFLFVLGCLEIEVLPTEIEETKIPTRIPFKDFDALTHTVTFVNNCENKTIWVGSSGNSGFKGINNGGWEMAPKGKPTSKMTFNLEVGWSGRFWPRTDCSFDSKGMCPGFTPCCSSGSCLTKDNKTFGLECAYPGVPPVGLIELTLDAKGGWGHYDTYDVSFVDGWGVSVAIEAVPGTFNPNPDPGLKAPWCTQAGCTSDPKCPDGLSSGESGCWSPCQNAVNKNTPKTEQTKLCCVCSMKDPTATCDTSKCEGGYGCTPYHNPAYPSDQVCNPWDPSKDRGWDAQSLSYISNVKAACPQTYAWQFDDAAATFNCRKTNGLVNYLVTFCPS